MTVLGIQLLGEIFSKKKTTQIVVWLEFIKQLTYAN